MVTLDQVRDWVQSEEYKLLLTHVVNSSGLSMQGEQTSDVGLQHDANKFNAAGLDPRNLKVFVGDAGLVSRYVCKKLEVLRGGDEQEGRDPEDEEDVTLHVHAFYWNFLNLYLIEMYFLQENKPELEQYLKSIRIPGAKKYAALIRRVYTSICRERG